MKKLLVSMALLLPAVVFSQVNQSGVIYLGLGTGTTTGVSTLKSTFTNSQTVKGSGASIKFSYGIKAQYGISDIFSLGIIVRRESATYGSSYTYNNNFTPTSTDVSTSGFFFAVDDKYYAINKEDFSLTIGPYLGYYTGSATLKTYLAGGSLNGFSTGLGTGFNWYWGDHYGVSLDIAYHYHSLSGEPHNPEDFSDPEEAISKYKVTGGGIFFCFGFVAKFGGD